MFVRSPPELETQATTAPQKSAIAIAGAGSGGRLPSASR